MHIISSQHAHNSVTACTQFSHNIHTIQSQHARNKVTTYT